MKIFGITFPFSKEPDPPPRQPGPVRSAPRNSNVQGEPVLRSRSAGTNTGASRGVGTGSTAAKPSAWERIGFAKGPSMEEFQRLEKELRSVRDDLAKLERDTQNDDASKVHREALHAALIKMDRRINGPAQ
jgi:hypothetical protein